MDRQYRGRLTRYCSESMVLHFELEIDQQRLIYQTTSDALQLVLTPLKPNSTQWERLVVQILIHSVQLKYHDIPTRSHDQTHHHEDLHDMRSSQMYHDQHLHHEVHEDDNPITISSHILLLTS